VLLACGGASVAVGLASWYLAGRSLGPARKAWEQQQVFVANASHELRAPVTLIRASAEYALRQNPGIGPFRPSPDPALAATPGVAEVLTDIVAETDHLSRLVDDLILLSRLDAGKIEVVAEPVLLTDLFLDVTRTFGRLAEEKGVALQVNTGEGVARGDRTRLRQVVLILLDNALRHTPPGGTISLETRFDGRRVVIAVADTGTGIAPEDLPHIFDRFYQARVTDSDNRGSGLGLSIAKSLVEALKGRIEVTSRPGEGTRMTLSLPRADATAPGVADVPTGS
jgi:signal transduction histidine kinase